MTNGLLPARYHIPAGLAAGTAVSVLAAGAGAGLEDQGLAPQDVPPGVVYGLLAGASVAGLIVAGSALETPRSLYRDSDIASMTGWRALYEGLVRIPLGTALPEEVVFRGALLALLSRRHSPLFATGLTSLLFGLWHVTPTFRRLETHAFSAGHHPARQAAWVATSVGMTTAAGLLLAGLRYRSRSLVAPWLAHSAANAAGLAATWLSARQAAAGRAATASDGTGMAPERAAAANGLVVPHGPLHSL
jgi:membrane protease YdiL (CAAX protease family)